MQKVPQEGIYGIAVNLPVKDLFNLCKTNKDYEKLCKDEYFWGLKLNKEINLSSNSYKRLKEISGLNGQQLYALMHSDFLSYPVQFEGTDLFGIMKILGQLGDLDLINYYIRKFDRINIPNIAEGAAMVDNVVLINQLVTDNPNSVNAIMFAAMIGAINTDNFRLIEDIIVNGLSLIHI